MDSFDTALSSSYIRPKCMNITTCCRAALFVGIRVLLVVGQSRTSEESGQYLGCRGMMKVLDSATRMASCSIPFHSAGMLSRSGGRIIHAGEPRYAPDPASLVPGPPAQPNARPKKTYVHASLGCVLIHESPHAYR